MDFFDFYTTNTNDVSLINQDWNHIGRQCTQQSGSITIMHLRASFSSYSSRILSPSSRRLARLLCLFFIQSLLQHRSSEIEKHHGSSSACRKASPGIVVLAFQQQQCPRRLRRQEQSILSIYHPLPSSSPSWAQTSLFFSNQDNEISSIKNGRRHLGKNHCVTQRCNSHKPLFRSGSNASDNDGGESGDSSNESSNGNKKRLFSMKRIGGRKRRQNRSLDDDGTAMEKSSSSSPPPTFVEAESIKNRLRLPSGGFLVVALLVLTLLNNLLFGGSDSDFYYYSYSSSSNSVYETRINPDGSQTTTETSRKESSNIKTNIPGLTDNRDVIDDRGTNYNNFYFDE
jgi:hypothetical protein